MTKHGFTLIELVVVITIMATLMAVGVITISGSQVKTRDLQKKSNAEAIAMSLESFYTTGMKINGQTIIGQYPSTATLGTTISQQMTILKGIPSNILADPDAPNNSSLISYVDENSLNAISVKQYIYKPLNSDGDLCEGQEAGKCEKFILYYKTEADGITQNIKSKYRW